MRMARRNTVGMKVENEGPFIRPIKKKATPIKKVFFFIFILSFSLSWIHLSEQPRLLPCLWNRPHCRAPADAYTEHDQQQQPGRDRYSICRFQSRLPRLPSRVRSATAGSSPAAASAASSPGTQPPSSPPTPSRRRRKFVEINARQNRKGRRYNKK